MAGKVLTLDQILDTDHLAVRIADQHRIWSQSRMDKVNDWTELRKYIYATDTTQTSNDQLPWKNKTTMPKLTQIRDNLIANYVKSLFPKRKWVKWEPYDKPSAEVEKREAIEAYMYWAMERSGFKDTVTKLCHDYVDYGNCFGTVEWVDDRIEENGVPAKGYVGPRAKRISPLDIVFNPIADNFPDAPKIVKTMVSLGDVKDLLTRITNGDNTEKLEELFNYLKEIRRQATTYEFEEGSKDELFKVDGFNTFREYLGSDYMEMLTFYGDLYDRENDKYYRNHIIRVIDRHKILDINPNPSFFGKPPIYHVGWRIRQDNLWAMGPLDNLVGMQYRIDHLENLKADVFDLIAFPPLKIKGYVEDFTWGPFERIVVGDDGDVELLSPDVAALSSNLEIQELERKMEEMAGSPKEAMGFRTPGEKTKYEVQRLENAASRVFLAKIEQFEEKVIEPLLNAMLELARRSMSSGEIKVFDEEFKINTFLTLTSDEITGNGKIQPVAAKHFAEQAERVQNATAFFNSALGQDQDVKQHFSGIKLAEMFEDLLDLNGYELVTPFVRISEQADAQRMVNSQMEQVTSEAGTPSGLTADDHTLDPNTVMSEKNTANMV